MAEARIKGGIDFDASSVKRGIKEANKSVSIFRKNLDQVKGSLVGAFAVGAGINLAKGVVGMGAQIKNQAKLVGVSTDLYQAFANSVKQVGGDVTDVSQAFADLRIKRDEAMRGDETAIKEFAGLGISVSDLATKDFPQLFEAVAKGLRATNNFADAAKILGEDGIRKINISLEEVADNGIEKFIQKAKEAGGVMDESFLKKAAEADAVFVKLTNRAKVMAASVVSAIWDAEEAAAVGVGATIGALLDKFKGKNSNLSFTENFSRRIEQGKNKPDPADSVKSGSSFDEQLRATFKSAGSEAGAEIKKSSQQYSSLRRIGANIIGRGGDPKEATQKSILTTAEKQLKIAQNSNEVLTEIKNKAGVEGGVFT